MAIRCVVLLVMVEVFITEQDTITMVMDVLAIITIIVPIMAEDLILLIMVHMVDIDKSPLIKFSHFNFGSESYLFICFGKVINYDDSIRIISNGNLRKTTVKTRPYPGFPTDMQAQICVCMSRAAGVSRLTESVYETRFFGYCTELQSMGANIQINGKTATVIGVETLYGATVAAHDLRAGAALVIAGLVAEGKTIVENIHFIERGYENLVEKLTALGATICRLED